MVRVCLFILLFIIFALCCVGAVQYLLQKNEFPTFNLSIELVAHQSDFLMLYHRNMNEKFSRDRRIKHHIAAGDTFEKIEFNLPKGASNIRLKLSENKKQAFVKIKQIVLQDNNGNTKIIDRNFLNYLHFNKYCHNIKETENDLTIEFREVAKRYDPHLTDLNLSYLLYYAR